MTQPISPEEYDAAVRPDPAASTHAATGDARSGCQLLADAAADRRRSIAIMEACRAGRAELDTFSALAEGLARGYGGGLRA